MPACTHYWVIEPASGSMSPGECQHCHEVREFSNRGPEPQTWKEATKTRQRNMTLLAPRENNSPDDDEEVIEEDYDEEDIY